MKMKNIFTGLIVICFLQLQFGHSQVLMYNSNFSDINKKPKGMGMIDKSDGWYSPTNAPADLFYVSGKADLNQIPVNKYGEEKARAGEAYAGLLMYSYNDREPRTYITRKLEEPLKKGEWYCIRFHVSLADLSKFAINNIGLYVSEEEVEDPGTGILEYDPQIIHSLNRVFSQMWDWEAICRIYVAKGGEQYITIGNFAKSSETTIERMKRPRGVTQPQIRSAYYYIDDVTVTPDGTRLNCKCEEGNYAFAHLDKEKKNFGSNPEDMPETEFIGSKTTEEEAAAAATAEAKEENDNLIVPFALAKSALSTDAKKKLDEAVSFIKKNTGATLVVKGHIDDTESRVPDLSKKRMVSVQKYLIINGVSADKISVNDVGESEPLDSSGLKENRHKNTVVEIIFNE